MKYLPVEGHPGLVRNSSSGAIINTNSTEMNLARKRKKIWQTQQDELKNLRSDVQEMKMMMQKILEGQNGNNN